MAHELTGHLGPKTVWT